MMQNPTSVIGRPSKLSKLVNGLKQYLHDARSNPSLKLTVMAISRAIGIPKSTIYLHQDDQEVAKLLKSIRALATARKLAALNSDEFVGSEIDNETNQEASIDSIDDAESISLELLTTKSAHTVRKAIWSMSRFIGRHRKHRHVSDLPRAVFDLDLTITQLHRVREELSKLSDEWLRFSRDDSEIVGEEDQLSLSYISKE